MAIEILMPALSPTMTEGNLAKWLKKEGDKVTPGDVIAEIETDKATMEVEATDEGILAKILIPEATAGVQVNQLIAVLLEDGENASAVEALIANQNSSNNASIAKETEPALPSPTKAAGQVVVSDERVFATPLARRLAAQHNVQLNAIAGSGPHGRIVKNDVLNAAQQSMSVKTCVLPLGKGSGRRLPETQLLPLTNMRKVIAARLQESKQTVPHFYLEMECNVDKLLQLRAEINAAAPVDADGKPSYRISVNDLVIKASALALQKVPQANVSWSEAGLVQYNNVDIAVAVAFDGGLITPIVHNADQKTIKQISQTMQSLAARAKANQLKPEEFQGGGFSISNLGMYGIKKFSAIINPPQACILAVGASAQQAVVQGGALAVASVLTLTLSCDHRALDGAGAAEFLNALRHIIEQPISMLI